MKYYPKKDTNQRMHDEYSSYIKKEIQNENTRNKVIREKNAIGYHEKQLLHYERQKKILLENLDNAKTESEKYHFNKLLGYNKENYEKTLLLIKQRDNQK